MSEVITRSIRVGRSDWRNFRQLQIELERKLRPDGQLSQADVFRIAIDTTTRALAGEVHVAAPSPPVEVTPVSMTMTFADEPKEPSG